MIVTKKKNNNKKKNLLGKDIFKKTNFVQPYIQNNSDKNTKLTKGLNNK